MNSISLLDNALLQGLSYGLAVAGVMLAFRVLRYPDLTPDGSFLLGSAAYSAAVVAGAHWFPALIAAFACGALAGVLTSLLNSGFGVNRLLTGILTSMMAYSIGYRMMGGRPNIGLGSEATVFDPLRRLDNLEQLSHLGLHSGQLLTSLLVALVVAGVVAFLLRSEWGLAIRALGSHPGLLKELRHKPSRLQAQGLALANGLVGVSAAVVVSRQGFVDINMAVGIVITLIAALVIGEAVLRIFGIDPARSVSTRILAVFMGTVLYFLLYILILRASILGWIPVEIRPTDLKLLSALAVVLAVSVRNRKGSKEEVLPF